MKSSIRVSTVLAAVAGAAWVCATAAPVQAKESAAAFYKGKTVRLIVGYGPGGGYDTYARMIAPYIAKALGATIVVENKPGAGGIKARDDMAVAPPDGLQMMIVNGTGAALGQLIKEQGVRYDLGKFGHLGTVSASPWVWLVTPDSPFKTPQDAIDSHKRIMWAAGGPIDGMSDGAAFTCAALKLKCRIVMGYSGSNQAALALGKGEMDSLYISDTSANNYVKAKEGRPIATMSRKKSRFFPDTPTIFSAVKLSTDQQWLFDFRATLESLGRILIVPPKVPADRLAYLQAAVRKALTNPALIAQGERTQRYIIFHDAQKTRAAVLKVVQSISPAQRQRIKAMVTKTETE